MTNSQLCLGRSLLPSKPTDLSRRRALGALLVSLSFGAHVRAADASWRPDKAVTIVAPFGAGANADTTARLLAEPLSALWKVPVIVENRPGANGAIGTLHVVRSVADGHTLLMAHSGLTLDPFVVKSLPYVAARDLMPVGPAAVTHLLLIARAGFQANSLKELLALAKRPESVSIAVPDNSTRLWWRRLAAIANVRFNEIPYKGAAASLADLMGEHVDASIFGIGGAIEQVRGGKIKALGVLSETRQREIPEVATFAEQGYPDFQTPNWFSLFAPASTPPETAESIARDVRTVVAQPDFRKKLAERSLAPNDESVARFRSRLTNELAANQKFVTQLGIVAE